MLTDNPNPVFHLLKEGIIGWFNGTDHILTMSSYPMKLHALIKAAHQEQSQIGWDSTLRGYLARKWRVLASESVFDHTSVNEEKGANDIRHILRAIQQLTRQLWLGRNKSLHDGNETELHSIRQEELAEI